MDGVAPIVSVLTDYFVCWCHQLLRNRSHVSHRDSCVFVTFPFAHFHGVGSGREVRTHGATLTGRPRFSALRVGVREMFHLGNGLQLMAKKSVRKPEERVPGEDEASRHLRSGRAGSEEGARGWSPTKCPPLPTSSHRRCPIRMPGALSKNVFPGWRNRN